MKDTSMSQVLVQGTEVYSRHLGPLYKGKIYCSMTYREYKRNSKELKKKKGSKSIDLMVTSIDIMEEFYELYDPDIIYFVTFEEEVRGRTYGVWKKWREKRKKTSTLFDYEKECSLSKVWLYPAQDIGTLEELFQ